MHLRKSARRAGLVIAYVVAAVALSETVRSQTTATDDGFRLALMVRYADGRTESRLVRGAPASWSPFFPRIPGAETARDGLALTGLNFSHVVERGDVLLTVSLMYGKPAQSRLHVATVRVTAAAPVVVDELRAFGVEPVTVSVVSLPATAVYPPAADSASSQLEVRIEPIAQEATVYQVVVTNHSTHALTAFYYEAYREDRLAVSGSHRGNQNRPLLLPNGEMKLRLALGSSGVDSTGAARAPKPIDRWSIISVLWDDKLFEGNPDKVTRERTYYAERARQIEQVLALLRDPRRSSIGDLRANLAALPVDATFGMQEVKDGVLAEFDAWQAGPARRTDQPPAIEPWLARTIQNYEQWLARIKTALR